MEIYRKCDFFSVYFFSVQSGLSFLFCLPVQWFFLSLSLPFGCWAHPLSSFLLLLFNCLVIEFLSGSLHLLFVCWGCIFTCFKLFIIAHWSTFIMAALKSLSADSKTSVILVSDVIDCLFSFSLMWFLVWQVIFDQNLDIFILWDSGSCLNFV